ncbi:MAG: signal peptidase I [Opitutaceae bacterium]|nr:signal peptidase I [Verrucomicrobiales bacterium]
MAIIIGRKPKRTFIRAVCLAAVCFVVFKFVVLPVRVAGISMEPTYLDGTWNAVNSLSYLRSEPQRGDVVGVQLSGRSIMFLKRIVGLPGETVAFDKGVVKIDGRPLEEPYLRNALKWDKDPERLGPDEFFVVGDNRSMDMADHSFGVAKRAKIVGKVVR